MDSRLIVLGLLIGAVSYLLWKLSKNEQQVEHSGSITPQCEEIQIREPPQTEVPAWIDWKLSYEDLVRGLSIITGFGGAFYKALELKSFRFRELVYSLGNQKLARAWLREAINFGLVATSFDGYGVKIYTIKVAGLRRIEHLIVSALEHLRRTITPTGQHEH